MPTRKRIASNLISKSIFTAWLLLTRERGTWRSSMTQCRPIATHTPTTDKAAELLGPCSFLDSKDAVYGRPVYLVNSAAGPVHFQRIDRRCVSQPEVNARVVGGSEAAPAENVAPLRGLSLREVDSRSHRILGALGAADQFQLNPVVTGAIDITQQRGRCVDIIEHYVN